MKRTRKTSAAKRHNVVGCNRALRRPTPWIAATARAADGHAKTKIKQSRGFSAGWLAERNPADVRKAVGGQWITASAQEQGELVVAPAGFAGDRTWYMDVLCPSNRWRVDCDDRAESRRSGQAVWTTTRRAVVCSGDGAMAVASPCGRPGRGIWNAATDATLRRMGVDLQEKRWANPGGSPSPARRS